MKTCAKIFSLFFVGVTTASLADVMFVNQTTEYREGLTACTISIAPEVDGKAINEINLGYGNKPYVLKTSKPVVIKKAMAICYGVSFEYEFTKPIVANDGVFIGLLAHKGIKVISYTKSGF